ncbi:MAG: T9SS type A sorting domain-containing protein [Saprospiraceae bacterium]
MKQILLFFVLLSASFLAAQPPYAGTIFIDPDIITAADPSAIESTTYSREEVVTMYDRRVNNWVDVNAFLFDVVWDDGLTSRAQVNAEFGDVATATIEAEKYAFLIGQLPTCLRRDVNEIWIHKGVNAYGGGNNSILIHTGQSALYERDGIIEETLVHEASHTSLDADHASSAGWIDAQRLDDEFISTYARDNPTREDIAESYLTWLMVRYRQDQISIQDFAKITEAIPNRLSYFDDINCDLYPFRTNTSSAKQAYGLDLKVFPNPASERLQFDGINVSPSAINVFDILGKSVKHLTALENGGLNIAQLPQGTYFLKLEDAVTKFQVKR